MTPELIGIITPGGLMIGLFGWLGMDLHRLRAELKQTEERMNQKMDENTETLLSLPARRSRAS